MKQTLLAILLFSFLTTQTGLVIAQSSLEELETQKRLNQVESKRATAEATISATPQANVLTFVKGKITSVTNSVISLSTEFGSKTVYTNDSTKFLNLDDKGKKLIGFGDLRIGESIMVVGLPSSASNGTARIVIRDLKPETNYFSTLGRVSEVNETGLVLKDHSRDDLPTNKLTFSANTTVKNSSKHLTRTDLKNDSRVCAVGTIDDKGTLIVSEILLF